MPSQNTGDVSCRDGAHERPRIYLLEENRPRADVGCFLAPLQVSR